MTLNLVLGLINMGAAVWHGVAWFRFRTGNIALGAFSFIIGLWCLIDAWRLA